MHQGVVDAITGLAIEVWPSLETPPEFHHDPTPSERQAFDQELKKWSDVNLLRLSALQHETNVKYNELHYQSTLDLIHLEQAGYQFGNGNDSVAFRHLTRSFLHAISLPEDCCECVLASVIDPSN